MHHPGNALPNCLIISWHHLFSAAGKAINWSKRLRQEEGCIRHKSNDFAFRWQNGPINFPGKLTKALQLIEKHESVKSFVLVNILWTKPLPLHFTNPLGGTLNISPFNVSTVRPSQPPGIFQCLSYLCLWPTLWSLEFSSYSQAHGSLWWITSPSATKRYMAFVHNHGSLDKNNEFLRSQHVTEQWGGTIFSFWTICSLCIKLEQ